MSKRLEQLGPLMRLNDSFSSIFEKELQSCYTSASQASETGDDRMVMIQLAQAKVWGRLLKAATPKP